MIVVTAPTGSIGSKVVSGLLGAGESVRVIARDPGGLDDDVRGRVEVVEGSHSDPAVLRLALDGADALFWLIPPNPATESVDEAYLAFARPLVAVLAERPVGRIVGVTALGRGTPQAAHAGNVTASLAADELTASAGIPFRALAMPSFMDNVARQASVIAHQGILTSSIRGERKMPTVATEDIAAVAVRLLTGPAFTGFADVPVLGPEDLSWEDMARIISEVLGRTVTFQQVGPEAYRARMESVGMSPAMAQAMTDMASAKDAGMDNAVARTPEDSTPTTFAEWVDTELRPRVDA